MATIKLQPKCELVAIIDTICEQQIGFPHYATLQEYLETTPTVDAFIIATPNGTHASLAIEVLEAGKHVLIEKPFALRRHEAEAVISKAIEAKKQVMVVLQNRYSPVSKWLKSIVEQDILGKVYFVEVNCFWNRNENYYFKNSWRGSKETDGGTLYTQFSHFIDILYWLFGDITRISSRFYNNRHKELISIEDTGSIFFEFVNNGAGCMNFTTASFERNIESSITIIAENGSIKISGQYMDTIEYCHIKDYILPEMPANDPSKNNIKMLEEFIKVIHQEAGSNSLDGLHSVDIIERMYTAAS